MQRLLRLLNSPGKAPRLVTTESGGHVSGNGIRPRLFRRSPTLGCPGLTVLAILVTLKRERRTALKQAARRRISVEQLTAAAIAGAVAEFVEAGE